MPHRGVRRLLMGKPLPLPCKPQEEFHRLLSRHFVHPINRLPDRGVLKQSEKQIVRLGLKGWEPLNKRTSFIASRTVC